MNIETENNIIGKIYDAALDISLWPNIIKDIVEYTESKTAIFTALDQLNPNSDFVYTFNISQECLSAYSDERIKVIDMNLHLPLWQQNGIGGTINLNLIDYKQSDNIDKLTFYNKCLEPTGISKITGILLDQSEYRWAIFALHRAPDAPEYSPEISDFLKRIGTHMRRALQIHKQLRLIQAENQTMYKMLDSIKIGILLIDEQHQLHYSNLRARNILEKSNLFKFDQINKISVNKVDQLKFEKTINSAIQKDVDSFELGGLLNLKNAQGEQFILTISPFHHINYFENYAKNKNYAAIFITKTNEKHHLAITFLKETYNLTTRECEICELFTNGFSVDEIAEFCHLTISSVRTYFKNIYTKLNCNSQTELLKSLVVYKNNVF